MYYKAHQKSTRTDVSQLKNEIIRKCYSNELAAKIEKIESVNDLDEHARKIEDAIKETAVATIPVKRVAKKLWISGETLRLVDEKRKLKQTKDVSKRKSEEHKTFVRKSKSQRDKIKYAGYSSSAKKSKRV